MLSLNFFKIFKNQPAGYRVKSQKKSLNFGHGWLLSDHYKLMSDGKALFEGELLDDDWLFSDDELLSNCRLFHDDKFLGEY